MPAPNSGEVVFQNYSQGKIKLPPPTIIGVYNPAKPIGLSSAPNGLQAKAGIKPLSENEVQINGKIYTITEDFLRKHPGGSVIKSKLGNNATQAFNEFHSRSTKAKKWLAGLPSREGFPQTALLDDFDKMRQELVDEGYFKFDPIHVAYRFIELALMAVFGYWLVLKGWYWTGMLVLGITSGRCGWMQHEANHHSVTGNIKIDKIIGSFFFSFGEAGSATWWTSSHNRHHASPQHVGYDSDLNTLPAMAFDIVTARLGKPAWLKFQAFTFLPSVALVVLYWKLYLHPMAIWRKKAWKDALFLVLHYVIWYKAFSVVHNGNLGLIVVSHLIWGSIAGLYLFTNFALSHTHKDVILADMSEDWVRSAVLRTTNIKHSLAVNWFMGYLNMQIEHHLFPNMPQFRHPLIADRVKALCLKHNLPYDERGYFEILYVTFKNLHDVGGCETVGVDLKTSWLKKHKNA